MRSYRDSERDFRFRRWKHIYSSANKHRRSTNPRSEGEKNKARIPEPMKGTTTENTNHTNQAPVDVRVCTDILTLYTAHSTQACDTVVTKPPAIKLSLKFADLWCPNGTACQFYLVPNYNPTIGVLAVAVGNQESASSPSCSLRIKEYRLEGVDGSINRTRHGVPITHRFR